MFPSDSVNVKRAWGRLCGGQPGEGIGARCAGVFQTHRCAGVAARKREGPRVDGSCEALDSSSRPPEDALSPCATPNDEPARELASQAQDLRTRPRSPHV
jgi:hypothetical protein